MLGNNIGNEGAIAIAGSLKLNQTLTSLDLSRMIPGLYSFFCLE
jgi:hypothetical protein